MRTTLDIPDDLVRVARKLLKTRTKRETVTVALREAIRQKQLEYLLSLRGKVDIEDVSEELERAEIEDAERAG